MKKLFYLSIAGILLFELMNIYFIMPMPGSQRMESIDIAYFLHVYRWVFRAIFIIVIIAGSIKLFQNKKKWAPIFVLLFTFLVFYLINFKMSADKMFLQPENIILKSQAENKVPGSRLVIGVENNGEAKAYPIEFLAYHHQVQDNVGNKQLIVTYCSVCRTGRVYEPLVDGHYENFRLVGMDHFNAMFEDASTGSWWRQSTGECITGSLKGKLLPEVPSKQMTVDMWFNLYPQGKVMQPDESFLATYDSTVRFEQGKSKGDLTRTDTLSWKEKSWVIGIVSGNACKAYDWNELKNKKIINDTIGLTSILLAISADGKSFVAFERPANKIFHINHDTLFSDDAAFNFSGQDLKTPSNKLNSINAYQEFWHSWATFHPTTQQYLNKKN